MKKSSFLGRVMVTPSRVAFLVISDSDPYQVLNPFNLNTGKFHPDSISDNGIRFASVTERRRYFDIVRAFDSDIDTQPKHCRSLRRIDAGTVLSVCEGRYLTMLSSDYATDGTTSAFSTLNTIDTKSLCFVSLNDIADSGHKYLTRDFTVADPSQSALYFSLLLDIVTHHSEDADTVTLYPEK